MRSAIEAWPVFGNYPQICDAFTGSIDAVDILPNESGIQTLIRTAARETYEESSGVFRQEWLIQRLAKAPYFVTNPNASERP